MDTTAAGLLSRIPPSHLSVMIFVAEFFIVLVVLLAYRTFRHSDVETKWFKTRAARGKADASPSPAASPDPQPHVDTEAVGRLLAEHRQMDGELLDKAMEIVDTSYAAFALTLGNGKGCLFQMKAFHLCVVNAFYFCLKGGKLFDNWLFTVSSGREFLCSRLVDKLKYEYLQLFQMSKSAPCKGVDMEGIDEVLPSLTAFVQGLSVRLRELAVSYGKKKLYLYKEQLDVYPEGSENRAYVQRQVEKFEAALRESEQSRAGSFGQGMASSPSSPVPPQTGSAVDVTSWF